MRAVAEGDHGRPADALRWGTRALRQLQRDCPDDNALHARILLTLAYQRWHLGELREADELLEQAELVDPAAAPLVAANRGEFLKASRPAAAIEHFDTAIAGLRSDRSPAGQETLAIVLLNRGVLHMSAGRLRQAQSDTDAAEAAGRRSGNDVVTFMATHNRGYVRFLAGNLTGALDTMAAATEVMPAAATGVSAMDRARVLLAAGLVAEAREFIDQAIDSFSTNRATADLAEALEVSAEIALLSGDPGLATTHARKAARIATKRGNDRAAMVIELVEDRSAALARGHGSSPARARADARKSADLARRLLAVDMTDDARVARLLQAQALLDAGDPAAAAAAADAASTNDRSRSGAPLATRLHARLVAGRIDLANGRHTEGLAEIRRGLDDLADFQARFGSQDLQSAAADPRP